MSRHVCQEGTKLKKSKCTNTDLVKVTDMPNICYILAEVMVQGPQKQCSRVSDVQIHKYKNTNTQIHFFSKLQICLTNAIFLKR